MHGGGTIEISDGLSPPPPSSLISTYVFDEMTLICLHFICTMFYVNHDRFYNNIPYRKFNSVHVWAEPHVNIRIIYVIALSWPHNIIIEFDLKINRWLHAAIQRSAWYYKVSDRALCTIVIICFILGICNGIRTNNV